MIKLQTSNSKTNFLLDSTNGFEKYPNWCKNWKNNWKFNNLKDLNPIIQKKP